MAEAKEKFKDEIERFIVLQYIFDKQWKAVRVSCHTCSSGLFSQTEADAVQLQEISHSHSECP